MLGSAVAVELFVPLVEEAAALVLETWVDVVEAAEEVKEDGLEETEKAPDLELDSAVIEADDVAAAGDSTCEPLSEGLLSAVESEGMSLVVACLRSLAGACRFPMLVCTHRPKQASASIPRLCIS